MSDRVYTFSVKPKDEEAAELVNRAKIQAVRTGVSFSRIVIDALKLKEQADKEQLHAERS